MERDGIEPPHVRDFYASKTGFVSCYHTPRVAPHILTDGGADKKKLSVFCYA